MDGNYRESIIAGLTKLGEELSAFGAGPLTANLINEALLLNPWFAPNDVIRSACAIAQEMLDEKKLRKWLEAYPLLSCRKEVLLILAGNIPMVGFHDILCCILSGHICHIKPSSRDKVLTQWLVGRISELCPQVKISLSQPMRPDAVISTGSDRTARTVREKYSGIPTLIRGSRTSVAVLSGTEDVETLNRLADDIFSYSGLGCRNVSLLLVPEGWDAQRVANILSQWQHVNPKYINNYLQRRATLEITGADFYDGGFFVIRESDRFPEYISELAFMTFSDHKSVQLWLSDHRDQIQCVVSRTAISCEVPVVAPGCAQMPSLADYADSVDTMAFLDGI